jgi:DNA primase
MHHTGRTYFESARLIKSKESLSEMTDEISKKLVSEPEYREFDAGVIDRLNQQALASESATKYFDGRKISKESMTRFKLGFSEKQQMVTVPVHAPDGMLVGFVGRSVEGKVFKNTPGLPKAKILFNLHRIKSENTVYVVESSFDAIRLSQCGIPAVATLGANVSNKQIELLKKYFNNVIIVADNDAAGGNMKNKILESLGSRVSVVQLNQRYKDIGDMEDEEIYNLKPSFDNSIMSMLK